MEEESKCELVLFTMDSMTLLAAKVAAAGIQEGKQLYKRNGGRKVVSSGYIDIEQPVDLSRTL